MRIAGVGCSLADFLYSEVDFNSPAFARLRSRRRGDGGIEPGRLVFLEAFEEYAGMSYQEAVRELVGEKEWDSLNVGGPSVVALILAAQLLAPRGIEVGYYGVVGDDEIGRRILSIVGKTPLNIEHYETIPGRSPFTMVLSDPHYDAGHGERAFVNNIGTSWHYGPDDLPESFFEADIVLFGATGLVPQLHDHLTGLVKKAKEKGCITVVTTVFDFRNEKKNPGGKWPLGENEETYRHTDLFIADHEEALRISGQENPEDACRYFRDNGVGAFVITHGPNPVTYFSEGRLFGGCGPTTLPVSQVVVDKLTSGETISGDTTGCGDNFAGGMLASLAVQLARYPRGELRLAEAVATGNCAGGAARFHLGGMIIESTPGEKAAQIETLYRAYYAQVAERCQLNPTFLSG